MKGSMDLRSAVFAAIDGIQNPAVKLTAKASRILTTVSRLKTNS